MCNYVPEGDQPDDLYLAIQIQRCPEEAAAYLADDALWTPAVVKG